jgi:dUTP pyrophosphatase
MVNIKVSWSDTADRDLGLPTYETVGAAGADLRANLPDVHRYAGIEISPGGRALIPTGLRLEIPMGYEVQVRARSGLALKNGITLANAIGTIDSDYRGDLGVILWNGGADVFRVTHGMRIAQMVVAPVVQATFAIVDALDETDRGAGGFGSTGAT